MHFSMIGKLSMAKSTEKFSPYEEKKFDSGWVRRTLKFNAICGDNRHFLTIQGGCFADGHGEIKAAGVNKGDVVTIPFKERKKSPLLSQVAEYRKFIVDLEDYGRRYKLERLVKKLDDGDLTEDDYKSVGLENGADIEEALANSRKKRYEFISEWDFAEFVNKILNSNKYTDKLFVIRGSIDYRYSDEKKRFYETYTPKRIYLADDTATPMSTATIALVYNDESLDDGAEQEEHKIYVHGYTFEYDAEKRKKLPVPTTITIDVPDKSNEMAYKKAMRIKSKFAVDDGEYKELGVEVDLLNGAQKIEITDDMLSDEQKEDLECGLITMDDIRAEMGQVYGDVVREFRFSKIARGYTKGRKDTDYTDEDMEVPTSQLPDEAIDLFDDEDDDDEI